MSAAYDAFTRFVRTNTADPVSWTHTPVGVPKGIAVHVGQLSSVTDHISSMTYGSVPMQRVVRAVDNLDEIGVSEWWVLLSNVPPGAQTIVVDFFDATTDDMHFVSISATSLADLEVVDFDKIEGNQANPQKSMQYLGRVGLGLCGTFSGHASATPLVEVAGMTRVDSYWSGTARGFIVSRETVPASADRILGYTAASEDVAFSAIVLSEVQVAPPGTGDVTKVADFELLDTLATTGGQIVIPPEATNGRDLYVGVTSRDHNSGIAFPTLVDDDVGGEAWVLKFSTPSRKGNLFHKKCGPGTAGKTITIAGAVGSCSAAGVVLDGAASGDPTDDATATTQTNVSGTAGEAHASITPTVANSYVMLLVFQHANDNLVTNPAAAVLGPLDPLVEMLSTGGSDSAVFIAGKRQNGGPAATGQFTWSQPDNVTTSMVVAVKPGNDAPAGALNFDFVLPGQIVGGQDLFVPVLSKGHTAGTVLPSVTDNDTTGNPWLMIAVSPDRKASLWYKKATDKTAGKTVHVAGGIDSLSSGLEVVRLAASSGVNTNIVVTVGLANSLIAPGFVPDFTDSLINLVLFNMSNVKTTVPAVAGIGVMSERFQKQQTQGTGSSLLWASIPQKAGPSATGIIAWLNPGSDFIAITFAIKPILGGGSGWTTQTKVDSGAQTTIQEPLFGADTGQTYIIDPSVLSLGGYLVSKQYGKDNEDITIDRVRLVATAVAQSEVGVSFTMDGGKTFSDEVVIAVPPGIMGSTTGSGWSNVTGQLFQIKVRCISGDAIVHKVIVNAQPRGRSA